MLPDVTIGVCTFKRPEGIAKCLESLLIQQTDFSYEIVVVENDPQQMSQEVIEAFQARAAERGISLRYCFEPESNLSIARNRCAAECRGNFLAMLDDDEWAAPDWLEKLVQVQKETGAEIIVGNPRAVYAENFPEYLKNFGEHCDQEHLHPSVEPVQIYSFGGCNVLLSAKLLKLRTPLFDPSFGKTGCEDVDLGWFFHISGYRMMVTGLPITYELEPLNRGRAFFYWERAFRNGINYSRIFQRYFYRMAGLQATVKFAWRKTGEMLWELLGIPFTPRRSLYHVIYLACFIIGLFGYFVGFRKTGY